MNSKFQFKYVPTLLAGVAYLVLLIAVLLLFMGRKYDALRWPGADQEFYNHVSNFTISYILVAGVGYIWAMQGASSRTIMIMAATMIILNFVYELFIPVLNTRDVLDAWYGFAGVLLAVVFILWTQKFGLRDNPAYNSVG